MPRRIALILAGAVAKGAFEAGVLEVLSQADVQVVRIVAASSGALNGVAYAAAVRARRERAGAAELVDLWRDKAGWLDIVKVDLAALVHREAVSNLSKVRETLRGGIKPAKLADPAEINLRLILANLDGSEGDIGGHPATTYEAVVEFDGPAFDDPARLDDVFTAVLASSSLPLLFSPTAVPGVGRCIDGGAVNNTPIGYAIGDALGQTIDAVVVIAPMVEHVTEPFGEQHGIEYIGHLVDMLINERLYRDLHEAEKRNATLRALAAFETTGQLAPDAVVAVRRALGWEGARPVDIIQVRPLEALPGNAFSAFGDARQRAAFIATGALRARAVFGGLGWL